MYRCRLVAGRRLSLLYKNARFQSNDAPQKPKATPRIASDWGGIRITNEPLSQQLTAHRIQTERMSGGAPDPEPQSESAPSLPLDQQPPPPPNAPILLDLPPPITLNAVGMGKLSPKARAFQKSLANLEQFFEPKQPEEDKKPSRTRKPVAVLTTGNVGPSGYVRRSAYRKEGAPQSHPTPSRQNAAPSAMRAAGRQRGSVSRAPVRRERQREPNLDVEEELPQEMTPEEFSQSIDQLLASATEEQSAALMQDAMEALDLGDQEKEALSDEDKRELVKEWVAHNLIEDLTKVQEEIDAKQEAEAEQQEVEEIDGNEIEEEDEDKWLASLNEEELEKVSESLDAATIQFMRFDRRKLTLEPEYLEADVDFALPPYEPADGLQAGLSPYRPITLATPRPPRDFARNNYSRSLPVKPRALRKNVAALGPLRHAQVIVGHAASFHPHQKERLAEIVAGVTSPS